MIEPNTRSRIVESARSLIAARGYADVGVAEICSHAAVKKGSFYHFFPSKQALTLEVLERFFADFKAGILEQAFRPEHLPMVRIDRLGELVYAFQKQVSADSGLIIGCPVGNLALELANQDETIRAKIEHLFKKLGAHVSAALQEAVDSGAIAELDVQSTAAAMVAYYEGVMLLAKTKGDPEVIRLLMPAMRNIAVRPGRPARREAIV